MLEKFICKTISRQVENIVHENYGISCLHDVCEDMAKVFIYLHVGVIDCEEVVCQEPDLTFTPTTVVEFECASVVVTSPDDPSPCSPINIISF